GVARVLVKRDDLTDLSLGGTKVRKLEYLLGEAQARGADTVITTAGAQSNFLRITAAAARRLGMQPVFVVRGRPDALSEGNLLLMRIFGADLRFVATDDPYDPSTVALMREIEAYVRGRGGQPYVMHLATFSGGLATVGYVSAAVELAEQLRSRQLVCDHLVRAVGSGTTYAGLLLGLRHAGVPCHILGASVNTAAAVLRRHVAGHMRAAAEILGMPAPDLGAEIDITDAHVGPGYGIPTEDSVEAIRVAAQTEGLVFDPIYTGKAWAALRHAVRAGAVARDATVTFVHTGGAPLVFQHAASVIGGAHVPIRDSH
ncbi:MAG: 1-aminocyclopropane-1-carboxylate deaminase/D-cysteine desulfhydrase, partial [bacterium]